MKNLKLNVRLIHVAVCGNRIIECEDNKAMAIAHGAEHRPRSLYGKLYLDKINGKFASKPVYVPAAARNMTLVEVPNGNGQYIVIDYLSGEEQEELAKKQVKSFSDLIYEMLLTGKVHGISNGIRSYRETTDDEVWALIAA